MRYVTGYHIVVQILYKHVLPIGFYLQDTRVVARDLLGKMLIHKTDQGEMSGIIVETEAYLFDDPASHSFARKTPRNSAMFGFPGHAYVYISYGLHQMLNVVTSPEGVGEAVLIRAVMPISGIEQMRTHRSRPSVPVHLLASGPGNLAQAFGISKHSHNGRDLTNLSSGLWIEECESPKHHEVVTSARIGLTKAVDQPWRYFIYGNRSVSGKKTSGTL
jgi:DNA-3-methyladenine glycosylase